MRGKIIKAKDVSVDYYNPVRWGEVKEGVPDVVVHKEDGVVKRIEVQCVCGKKIRIELKYEQSTRSE